MGQEQGVDKVILTICADVCVAYDFKMITETLKWLNELTSADTCESAIAIAWMRVSVNSEEAKKLSILRDIYYGSLDGKVSPKIDMEEMYKKSIKK